MNPLIPLLLLTPKRGSARAPAPEAPPRHRDARSLPKRDAVKRPEAAATSRDRRPKAAATPAPWPAAMPSGLPPWPMGWEPETPARRDAIDRAAQLIPALHAQGLGAHVTEFIGGRWLTFVARMHGRKKAVEAYRVKRTAPVRPRVPSHETAPAATPVRTPVAPATPAVAPATEQELPPTLRRGDGMGAREFLEPDVTRLQQLLNDAHAATPPLTADGDFGPKTQAAVIAYQTAYGLDVDGVVGPKTWASLLSSHA